MTYEEWIKSLSLPSGVGVSTSEAFEAGRQSLRSDVIKLKKEVNEVDQSLHSCAGVGAWNPPYPEVEDD